MALARLDSSQGLSYLAALLDRSTLFTSKSQSSLRVTAAEALLRCQNPDAQRDLVSYREDRNKEVRDMARRAASKVT